MNIFYHRQRRKILQDDVYIEIDILVSDFQLVYRVVDFNLQVYLGKYAGLNGKFQQLYHIVHGAILMDRL